MIIMPPHSGAASVNGAPVQAGAAEMKVEEGPGPITQEKLQAKADLVLSKAGELYQRYCKVAPGQTEVSSRSQKYVM
jgi:hypothetical protein